MLGSKRLCSAVSPMSAAPTSDTEKKNRNGANLKLRHTLRAGGVMRLTWKLKFDFGSANHWFGAIGVVRKRANQMDQF